ncbi:MAG: hypothetical protein K6B72_04715 [Lachnospiraceae bacterium]|nr:hypothetical protein [Lachnospiraceae bacterium]
MEDRRTVFHYFSELFATYGVIVAIFLLLDLCVGEAASGYSSLFAYGKEGLSAGTLAQLLALALIITVLRNILLTDNLIGSMSMITRNVLFFLAITGTIILFVLLFAWFPADDASAWIGFLISFAVCSALAILISRLKEKAENERMNRALEKYRNM